MLGVHRPSISEMEAGRRKVSAEEITKFAEIYGVRLEWLAGVESPNDGINEDRVKLAARELNKLKPKDLDRLIILIQMLKAEE